MMKSTTPHAQESTGVEEDNLSSQLRIARTLIESIRQEAQHALCNPEIALLSICRIAARTNRGGARLDDPDKDTTSRG